MITYSVVISACGKCGMPERALQLFDELQQQGLEPNVITYTAVISANGRTLRFLERCCSRDFCPIDHLHRSDQSQVSDLAAV